MLLVREAMHCKPGKVRPVVEKFLAVAKLGAKAGMPTMLVATAAAAMSVERQPAPDYAKLDVCRLIPGAVIAKALGGALAGARPVMDRAWSRCVYFIVLPGGTARAGYPVWVQPPSDFEELKQYIDEPLMPLSGLGDGAYMFQDKGDGRFKIHVLKRDDLMFEVSGESATSARKVAEAVAAYLWKRAP